MFKEPAAFIDNYSVKTLVGIFYREIVEVPLLTSKRTNTSWLELSAMATDPVFSMVWSEWPMFETGLTQR